MVLKTSFFMGTYTKGKRLFQLMGTRLKIGRRPLLPVSELSHRSQHRYVVEVKESGILMSTKAHTQCGGICKVSPRCTLKSAAVFPGKCSTVVAATIDAHRTMRHG